MVNPERRLREDWLDALARMRGGIRWLALGYSLFVVYGSLVPFDFKAVPWDEAVARFRDIPMLTVGIGSRADWVANILLFIPMAFLWMGVFAPSARGSAPVPRGAMIGLAMLAACVALSFAIEFIQIFFPPRTVSRNDILAEGLGALIGIGGWWLAGGRVIGWMDKWRFAHGGQSLPKRLLWAYLLILFGYNVLPLDLTVSPVELFHKWREGKLQLIPFMGLAQDPARLVYDIVVDILIWVPVPLLWVAGRGKAPFTAWRDTVLLAVLLECLQLFVYSRYTNTTDIFAAAMGAAIGVMLAKQWPGRAGRAVATSNNGMPGWAGLLVAVGWAMLILIVFWYPYDFVWERTVLSSRLEQLSRVPFTAFYFGTEYRAATEFLHKLGFFVPLGVFIALGRQREPNWSFRSWYGPLAAGLAVATALVAEGGKVFLPGKSLDSVNLLLEVTGGIGGYLLTKHLLKHATRTAGNDAVGGHPGGVEGVLSHPVRDGSSTVSHAVVGISIMAMGLWMFGQIPGVPYNVAELFVEGHAWWTALLLALFSYLWVVLPVRFARVVPDSPAMLWQATSFMLGHGLIGYLLIRLAVPEESLGDIVGAPILSWPWEFEYLLRFVALNGTLVILLLLAARTVFSFSSPLAGKWLWITLLPWLLIGYGIVVPWAATDNLVELLAPEAWAHVFIGAFFFGLFLCAGLMAARPAPGKAWLPAVAFVTSIAATFVCLKFGLNWHLDKYGKQFSALQFLLSPDREHYVGGVQLWFRLAIAHYVALLVLLALQWPQYRVLRVTGKRRRRHRIPGSGQTGRAGRAIP